VLLASISWGQRIENNKFMAVICREIDMRFLKILIPLGAAILASANAVAATPPASNSDKAAIQALEDTYNDGFNSKDVDKVMSVYLPGKELFVFDVVPPREYKGWDAYKKDFDELFSAFPGPMKNTISEQTIHVVGSMAYGHNIQTGEFTGKDGAKVKIVVRTTDIFRKINGKWLIVEEHNSVPVDLDTMKPDLQSKP
jgi:ketosteroid isomerase-like protein